MSNYPPGTSAGDPRAPWNAPDHRHEHKFYDVEGPIFEDGAAMFYARCQYVEGRWGEGWSCEESRWWRCDVERIVLHRDDAPDVAYLASTERPGEEWRHVERLFEEILIEVEQQFRDGTLDVVDVYPADEYGDGHVVVQVWKYSVVYVQVP